MRHSDLHRGRHRCRGGPRSLATAGINVSVSAAASAQFDLPARGLAEVVRASVHYYNTDAELDRLCEAVQALGEA